MSAGLLMPESLCASAPLALKGFAQKYAPFTLSRQSAFTPFFGAHVRWTRGLSPRFFPFRFLIDRSYHDSSARRILALFSVCLLSARHLQPLSLQEPLTFAFTSLGPIRVLRFRFCVWISNTALYFRRQSPVSALPYDTLPCEVSPKSYLCHAKIYSKFRYFLDQMATHERASISRGHFMLTPLVVCAQSHHSRLNQLSFLGHQVALIRVGVQILTLHLNPKSYLKRQQKLIHLRGKVRNSDFSQAGFSVGVFLYFSLRLS